AHRRRRRRDRLRHQGGRLRGDRGLRPARRRRAGRVRRARCRRPERSVSVDARPPGVPDPDEAEDPKAIASGMTLADISIRNHVFAWMLMAGLIGFGLICFAGYGTVVRGLGVSQNPDVDFPVVNVAVTYE